VVIGGKKLFEEIDKPAGMKILSEGSEGIEIGASWTGEVKGFNGFPMQTVIQGKNKSFSKLVGTKGKPEFNDDPTHQSDLFEC
jgi:hypothetical protein